MLERFTEQARELVLLIQDEARNLKHNYIGPEHILLGLLCEQGLAARVLEPSGITLERVRAQVARIVGVGDEVTSGQITFTPRGKRVLEQALREAFLLRHDEVRPEHILLGLMHEPEGVVKRIVLDASAPRGSAAGRDAALARARSRGPRRAIGALAVPPAGAGSPPGVSRSRERV